LGNRILILGASGFIGNKLYKELLPYFDVYGTFKSPNKEFEENAVMFHFDMNKNTIKSILTEIQPNFIIPTIKGNYKTQFVLYQELLDYVLAAIDCKLLYLSSFSVFDAKGKFPSYEEDLLSSNSLDGKYNIKQEKTIKKLPSSKYVILRLPMILGVNSPKIVQLKEASKYNAEFEIFPNLVISANTINKIVQQIHYIINKNLEGIFHLSSNDMIHHSELFYEINDKLGLKNVIFKKIYTSNKDSYLAILPKQNLLPKNYQITLNQIISDCVLQEAIDSAKE
jgi:dTDP-4-dehydrorhamnose reductase